VLVSLILGHGVDHWFASKHHSNCRLLGKARLR